LRAAVGGSAIIQGLNSIASSALIVGILEIASGALVVIGFLTPIAAVVIGLSVGAAALAHFSLSSVNLGDAKWMSASVVLLSAALALLGPGAISIDARLFGRREIIIPRRGE
jgi:uncharacterized membrane protein YphA (DoxX/SURF4 family)